MVKLYSGSDLHTMNMTHRQEFCLGTLKQDGELEY